MSRRVKGLKTDKLVDCRTLRSKLFQSPLPHERQTIVYLNWYMPVEDEYPLVCVL